MIRSKLLKSKGFVDLYNWHQSDFDLDLYNFERLMQWFLTGGTCTPWGYEASKQGVRYMVSNSILLEPWDFICIIIIQIIIISFISVSHFRQGVRGNIMKAQGVRAHKKVKNHWPRVLEDFNASTGTDRDGYETCVVPHGSGTVNLNSTKFLDFARSHRLRMAGSWFQLPTSSSLDLVFKRWWCGKGDWPRAHWWSLEDDPELQGLKECSVPQYGPLACCSTS